MLKHSLQNPLAHISLPPVTDKLQHRLGVPEYQNNVDKNKVMFKNLKRVHINFNAICSGLSTNSDLSQLFK